MVKLMPKMPSATPGGMVDIAGMVAVKTLTEAMTAPYLGNNTLNSAVVKLVAAVAIDKFVGGKYGRILAGGMVFDGAEDAIGALGISGAAGGLGTKIGGLGRGGTEAADAW
jgi:hypothetical protein